MLTTPVPRAYFKDLLQLPTFLAKHTMSICSEAIIFGVGNTENNTYFHIIVEIMKKIRALSSPWKKIEWWKLQASLTNGNSGQPCDVWGSSHRTFWKLSALRAFLEHLQQFLKHNISSKICYFYFVYTSASY